MEIGLATLRRDGWVSMDAGPQQGSLTIRPFVHPGGSLFMNADAMEGAVRVEYLDASGRPLAENVISTKITGDHIRQTVPFPQGTDSRLQGTQVRLRLSAVDVKRTGFGTNRGRYG